MPSKEDWKPAALLRGLGSLWLGTVLLMVLLVGMACATVFESLHGTEQALAMFYKSWWFEVLLFLLAVNVCIALSLRWPFTRKRIGFVVTHVSILLVLAGAMVTEFLGVDGMVGILEGEAVEDLNINRDTITLARRSGGTETTADLGLPSGGHRPVERPAVPALNLGDVRVKVVRYLPDSVESRQVVNDSPRPSLAVELSLSGAQGQSKDSDWVFADRTARLGGMSVLFREVDAEELGRLSAETPKTAPKETESLGSVHVDYQGSVFELSVEECMENAVPLGETGFTLKVVRYMPHAVVGSDRKLQNASDEPINPAIEVELVGPDGAVKRPAFAKFPGFWSTHGQKGTAGPKVVFVASNTVAPPAPISVLSGPDGKLYARFARPGQPVAIKELTVGQPCETPLAGRRLTVLRRFDHARIKQVVEPVESVRKDRVPALLLEVTSPSGTESVWLQKYRSHAVTVDDSTYDVAYADKRVPLGFSVKLKDFQIGPYPGTSRPRSFESQISILDPLSGRELTRVISMNRPTKYGGYTFYQSSYRQQGDRMVSVLSVSRDPGQPIVFAGYIGMLAGMLLVLTRRILDRRAAASRHPQSGNGADEPSKPKSSSA